MRVIGDYKISAVQQRGANTNYIKAQNHNIKGGR